MTCMRYWASMNSQDGERRPSPGHKEELKFEPHEMPNEAARFLIHVKDLSEHILSDLSAPYHRIILCVFICDRIGSIYRQGMTIAALI